MKKIISVFVVALTIFTMSCSEIRFADDGLSRPPETSGATIDSLFSSLESAEKVLVTAYSFLPYGIPVSSDNKMGGNILESITDFQQSSRNNINDGPINLYYNGALSSSLGDQSGNENYRFASENEYNTIRYAWIYVENAHKIPGISEATRNSKIAEAKICIAIAYAHLLRYCGGVPILDHAIGVNEQMRFPRNTFAQTVEFIVKLIDDSKESLPWVQNDVNDGRMTKAGALALKLRVLCFAASETFNSTPFHKDANEYHTYGNYKSERWDAAKAAAQEFMGALQHGGFYELVLPTEQTHKARRLAYRSGYYDRGTTEMIISIRRGFSYTTHGDYIGNRLYSGPTLTWANMYPWADGSDFPKNFNWADPVIQPFFEPDGSGNPPGRATRDPRLYENIAVPGDIYYDGTVAPLHTDHPSYRAGGTGFYPMKFILQQSAERSGKPVHWPLMRFAEVLLNAAEAINEADNGPNNVAYDYVNRVRARVGLDPLPTGMNRLQFRAALIHERALEFGYEEVRWFDLIRWGLKDDFTKKLQGLSSKAIDRDKNNPTAFTFETFDLPSRLWASKWDSKWYLAPIPRVEIDKEYGMTQNPGW